MNKSRLFLAIASFFVSLFLTANVVAATVGPLDLSGFSVIQYDTNVQPSVANWVLGSGNTSVTQTTNNEPSFFLGDFDSGNKTMEWDVHVNSSDDDGLGFVWGYQDFNDFYALLWVRQPATPDKLTVALVVGVENNDPFVVRDPSSTTLASSTIPWVNNTNYHFLLDFTPGQTEIVITSGGAPVESFMIADTTYTLGGFGFYTYSQDNVTFSNLIVSAVPVPPAVWLFGSGLLGLVGIARRKKTA